MKAAAKEFMALGFGGARMQVIADQAGINKALLHYHFSSKEKLYHRVIKNQFAPLMGSLLEIFDSDGGIEQWLRLLIGKLVKEIGSKPQFSRFVIWELNTLAKHLPLVLKEIIQERSGTNPLTKIREKLDRAGLGDYSAEHFILNVMSLCIYPSLARPLLEEVIGKELYNKADFMAEREEEIFA
ncbi:MAG: TetR/AcrR family transcriptional regulator, partial [Candidatus Cloacimonadaceae bacterium]|nr:TetR/AcrR family transcriptional regulator [Candidatus Cloacimonadaceae bacterium]